MYDPCFPVIAAPRVHPLVAAVRRALNIGHPVHHAPTHHAALTSAVAHPPVAVPLSGCLGVVNPVPGGARILPAGPGPAAGRVSGGSSPAGPAGGLGGASIVSAGTGAGLAGGSHGVSGGGVIGPIGAGAAALGAGAVGAVLATSAIKDSSSPAAVAPTDLAPAPLSFAPGPVTPGTPGVVPTGVTSGSPDTGNSVPEPAGVVMLTVAVFSTVLLRRVLSSRQVIKHGRRA